MPVSTAARTWKYVECMHEEIRIFIRITDHHIRSCLHTHSYMAMISAATHPDINTHTHTHTHSVHLVCMIFPLDFTLGEVSVYNDELSTIHADNILILHTNLTVQGLWTLRTLGQPVLDLLKYVRTVQYLSVEHCAHVCETAI
jgi:hypothetical protein